MKHIINDEKIENSHGFHLVNMGGDFARFTNNPIMLFAHDDKKPIGVWQDLKIEDSLLLATPLFDNDEPSQIIKSKVDKGSLKGLSVGMRINKAEWRENPVTDKEELYVTEWELLEISIVSIPSNPKSLVELRVYDNNHDVVADVNEYIKLSFSKNTHKEEKMKELTLTAGAYTVLNLNQGADAMAVSCAIEAMGKEILTLASKVLDSETAQTIRLKTEATALVTLAVKEGKVDAKLTDKYVELGVSNFELLKDTLDGITPKSSLSAQLQNTNADGDREKWDFSRWKREDAEGLTELKINNPEEYKLLTQGKNRNQK